LIVVDIETSGLDIEKDQILSIGAVDLDNASRTFYEECRLLDGAKVSEEALRVTGFSLAMLTDKRKPILVAVLRNFLDWTSGCTERTLAGENPWFDIAFLRRMSKEYGLAWQFGHRYVDLHSLSYVAHLRSGKLPPPQEGRSSVSLDQTLQFVGLRPRDGVHNALTDAKLEAEAISRLVYSKSLLKEFSQYRVPDYLGMLAIA